MIRRISRCLVGFLFFARVVAEESEVQKPLLFSLAKNQKAAESPVCLANLEGEPSAYVHQCVNIISGQFCDFATDLVVYHGVNPLTIERQFFGTTFHKGFLGPGWTINHTSFLDKQKHTSIKDYTDEDRRTTKSDVFILNHDHGGQLYFGSLKSKYDSFLRILPYSLCGTSNTAMGHISGQTNLKNLKLSHRDEGIYRLFMGNGSLRLYKRFKQNTRYSLESEALPNGNSFAYHYESRRGGDYLTGLQIYNSEKKVTGELSFEPLTQSRMEDDHRWKIKSVDGSWVRYFFCESGRPNLKEVRRSDGSYVYYNYLEKQLDLLDRDTIYELVTKKGMPEGRFLGFDYYEFGHNQTIIGDLNFKDREDPRIDRIKRLLAPAGTDSTPIPIYHFIYDLNVSKKTSELLNGACIVFDALNNKTHYTYDAKQRLVYLDKFHQTGAHYTREALIWGAELSKDRGCLLARTFETIGSGLTFAHAYQYDDHGNVLQDNLYGNLSGSNLYPPQLGGGGAALENGCECYRKTFTYSKDGLNLLLRESDGVQTTVYVYYPGSNRLIGKFQGSEEKWLRRWFYVYNEDAAPILEITDDGCHLDLADLTGVTERKLTYFTQRQTYPVAYPEVIEEKCLDLSTGQELLIHKVVNTYNSQCKIIKQDHYDSQGAFAYSLQWEYDAMGNMTKEIDAIGRTVVRQYDINGNCLFEQGPRQDCHKKFTYDFMNRLIKEEQFHDDGVSRCISHRYDYIGNRLATIDENGNESLFTYDAFGRVIQITAPKVLNEQMAVYHPVTKKGYDAMGNVISLIDPRGMETKSLYTIRNQLAHAFYADGSSEHNIYNLDGTLKETLSKNHTLTRYTYDILQRPIKTETFSSTGELLATTTSVYSGFHLLMETDPMGIETHYTYYPDGKLKCKRKEDNLTLYFYDSLGRVEKTHESTVVKHQQYDLLNRVIDEKIEDEQGNILTHVSYAYDISGNVSSLTTYQDEGPCITTTNYDSHGVPTLLVDAEDNKTITTCRYDYCNSLGQCVPYKEITDPLGNITVIIQDALGRTVNTSRKNALGKVTQQQEFFYDANGNQTVIVDTIITPGGPDQKILTLMLYDSVNHLIAHYDAVATPEQKQTKWTYNAFGQLQDLIKNDGIYLSHTYDAFGRLASINSSDNTIHYTYRYDLNGNPLNIEDHIHHICTQKTYDSNNRLTREKLANGLTIEYAYDHLNRPIKVTLPDSSGISYSYFGNHLKTVGRLNKKGEMSYLHTYEHYDQAGHPTKSLLAGQAGSLHYQYDRLGRPRSTISPHWKETNCCYDPVGNLLERSIEDNLGTFTTFYTYDDLYQLSSEQGATSNTYSHDSHFNRITKNGKQHTLNPLHQLLNDGLYSYTYDLNGNLIRKASPDGTQNYTYDAFNRLTSITNGDQKTDYTYDESNRRLSKTIQENDTINYLYQGQNEIAAYSNDAMIEFRLLGIGKGAEIGAAVAMEIDSKTYVPLHDLSGSISCLLDLSSGEPLESYRYTAFGEELFESTLIPWRFASKRLDLESKLIYFGRRYYDPETGRWISPDPIGREGGPNLYTYVLNSPLTHVDLYGLLIENPIRQFFGSLTQTRFFSNMLKLPGRTIESIGHNLSPVPFVQDIIEFGGWCLKGQNPFKYVPNSKRQQSELYVHEGYGENNPREKHLLFNGIGVSKKDIVKRAAKLSEAYGGTTVYAIYNASHGFLLDIEEVICQKLGIPIRAQYNAEEETQKIANSLGEGGTLVTHAHSQGAETVSNLSPGLKKMMNVTAYGPARVLHNEHFKKANNYLCVLDYVTPMADPVGLAHGIANGNVHFLGRKGSPLTVHDFEGPTYAQVYNAMGNDYKTLYGSVEWVKK